MTPIFATKKPVRVEAVQVPLYESFYSKVDIDEIARWCGGTVILVSIEIPTLEGSMLASPGDWIIKGVAGEFYPCKDAIFRATYDIEEPPSWSNSPVHQRLRDAGLDESHYTGEV